MALRTGRNAYAEIVQKDDGVNKSHSAGHHRVTWPVCGEHGRGLHVGYFHETAVWKCAGGTTDGHVVSAIDPAVQL